LKPDIGQRLLQQYVPPELSSVNEYVRSCRYTTRIVSNASIAKSQVSFDQAVCDAE